ncbi:hypothetical protein [Pseudomonas laurylsulfatiphila]|uniref:hypothetical protein n=1 Tax=Pseudomonas laurylsulfatiphila TaxID=2011015 RepID=UPI003D232FB8
MYSADVTGHRDLPPSQCTELIGKMMAPNASLPDAHGDSRGSKMEANQLKKEGVLTITIGFVLIIVALILSSGYDPRGGLLWSLSNNMYLLDIAVECEEQIFYCEEDFILIMQTKYIVSTLGLLLIYGVGQYLEFFPSMKFWSKKPSTC